MKHNVWIAVACAVAIGAASAEAPPPPAPKMSFAGARVEKELVMIDLKFESATDLVVMLELPKFAVTFDVGGVPYVLPDLRGIASFPFDTREVAYLDTTRCILANGVAQAYSTSVPKMELLWCADPKYQAKKLPSVVDVKRAAIRSVTIKFYGTNQIWGDDGKILTDEGCWKGTTELILEGQDLKTFLKALSQ